MGIYEDFRGFSQGFPEVSCTRSAKSLSLHKQKAWRFFSLLISRKATNLQRSRNANESFVDSCGQKSDLVDRDQSLIPKKDLSQVFPEMSCTRSAKKLSLQQEKASRFPLLLISRKGTSLRRSRNAISVAPHFATFEGSWLSRFALKE